MPSPTPSPADLLAELDAQTAEQESLDAAPLPRRKNIHVHYRTGEGTILEGACIFEIPDTEGYLRIGALEARMTLGLPLDGFAAALVRQIAYLEVTLVGRPEWMRDLRKVPDPELIRLIHKEANEHEARFRGGARDLRQGAVAQPQR